MPMYMIERQFAEQLDVDEAGAAEIRLVNEDEGVRWLYSFLSADKRKTYCLYEAPSVEVVRRAAERAGLPADVVIELSGRVEPDGNLTAL